MKQSRRLFLKRSGYAAASLGIISTIPLIGCNGSNNTADTADTDTATPPDVVEDMFFKISLAQWSFHKALGIRGEKSMDNLDFAAKARSLGIDGVEYVNQFFKDKAQDQEYLKEMIKRADDNGVKSLLIMVDGEGGLGLTDDDKRNEAVENHKKWLEAAQTLGCHSIRVNAYGEGTAEEVAAAAVQGLGDLATLAKDYGLNVIVENHGGYSSDGSWLAGVMSQINMDNCGTLPDFGNFCIERDKDDWTKCLKEYDRYQGVADLMPYAKAVSAKAHEFGEDGNEVHSDYMKIMQTVKDAGYTGYVGIEYEGSGLTEEEGIIATRDLLIKVGKALS